MIHGCLFRKFVIHLEGGEFRFDHRNENLQKVIEKLLKNETPLLCAFPEEPDGMIRDYVYVKDIVQANVIALERGGNVCVNIGTGEGTTTGCLLREISKQMNKEYNHIKAEPRNGDIRRSCLNVSKAKHVLNWKPTFSLSTGVSFTIKYFMGQEVATYSK